MTLLQTFGEYLGYTIVVLYTLTVLNYVVKRIKKHFGEQLAEHETLNKVFEALMKPIVKHHQALGIATVIALLAHFGVQFSWYGFNLTGALAGSILILQTGLGIYGAKKERKGKTWLWLHRLIAVVLLIAIYIHIA